MINTYILNIAEYYRLNINSTSTNTNINSEELTRRRKLIQAAQEAAKKRGSKLSPNSKVIKEYKAILPIYLPFTVFCVIIGNMLGDCSINYDSSKNQASLSGVIRNMLTLFIIFFLIIFFLLPVNKYVLIQMVIK